MCLVVDDVNGLRPSCCGDLGGSRGEARTTTTTHTTATAHRRGRYRCHSAARDNGRLNFFFVTEIFYRNVFFTLVKTFEESFTHIHSQKEKFKFKIFEISFGLGARFHLEWSRERENYSLLIGPQLEPEHDLCFHLIILWMHKNSRAVFFSDKDVLFIFFKE